MQFVSLQARSVKIVLTAQSSVARMDLYVATVTMVSVVVAEQLSRIVCCLGGSNTSAPGQSGGVLRGSPRRGLAELAEQAELQQCCSLFAKSQSQSFGPGEDRRSSSSSSSSRSRSREPRPEHFRKIEGVLLILLAPQSTRPDRRERTGFVLRTSLAQLSFSGVGLCGPCGTRIPRLRCNERCASSHLLR